MESFYFEYWEPTGARTQQWQLQIQCHRSTTPQSAYRRSAAAPQTYRVDIYISHMLLTQKRMVKNHEIEPCPVRQTLRPQLDKHMTQGEVYSTKYSRVLIKMDNIEYNKQGAQNVP